MATPLLTWRDVEQDVSVVRTHHLSVLALQLHTAVAALVLRRDVLQVQPEALPLVAVGHAGQVVAAQVAVARAHQLVAGLLGVRRVQPEVLELVVGVQLGAPVGTLQLGGGPLGAGVDLVDGEQVHRLRGVVHGLLGCGWEGETTRLDGGGGPVKDDSVMSGRFDGMTNSMYRTDSH